ncbi:ABC transporter permease [Plantactinospora soyae]|uniref:ABC-2 type transport system permease protein n=1 Tax=Plantactinospora soyae TaxID=1544732 RepID=A0A927MD74_9ACTN|nr:anibiotic ABC transporter [Plantactinospora soyae]MBE1488935.1 ABC-2 type transport system permease protein [Plantactinospora soyae]
MGGTLTGTARLARLALRRDRVQLPLWILGTTVLLSGTYAAAQEQFPTEADRLTVLRTAVETPAILMLRNVPTGTSNGEMIAFQIFPFLVVTAGFMSTLAVVRHTRQNEETGRTEMVSSMVVGRHASLAAAMIVTAGANLVLAGLLALTLLGNGEPTAGSLTLGLAVGAGGLAFAAIAAVAAQVSQTARAANGIAAAAIGAAYLVRGLGDALGEIQPSGYTMTTAWPSWLSPIGWTTLTQPFAGNRWWVLGLPLALAAAGTWLAFALTNRRDIGMGMIAARPGPAKAVPGLLSPLGLAWRLQRGTLLGWAIAIGLFGVTIGSLSGAVEAAFDGNEGATRTIRELGGDGSLIDSFYSAMLAIIGAMVAGYVVQALLRVRAEEVGGRAEPTLATGVGRLRWLGSHLVVTVFGAVLLLAIAGISAGLVAGVSAGNTGDRLADLTIAALAQLAPALIMVGFVLAVFGLVPRLTVGIGWAGFAIALIFGQLGELLNLPQAVRDISPFSHVPALPAGEASVTPLVLLAVVAVALGAAGMALFRRRDLAL